MFERCIYFNMNALTRKLNGKWNVAFARFDLPPSHGYLLRLVLSKPGLSQKAISEELSLEKSTITRFLSQLEKKGLIARKVSEFYPRQKLVYPTNKSLALRNELDALGDDLYTAMCEKLGKRNIQNFVATLREVSEQI